MGRKKTKKRAASRIPDNVEKRVVVLSLANPEFGARRLVPLLADEGKQLSTSAVYTILKRNGLQTREKRLATIETQRIKDHTRAPEKASVKIPAEAEARITEISLQNPDFGARRLVPLLEQEKISITTNAVYRILKSRGFENRTKRLAALEKRRSENQADKPPKIPARISLQIEERIVEISLGHPGYGAKRLLPLLKDEQIIVAASTVYTVLKRHGLQNRTRRLAAIEERRRVEVPQPIEALVPEPEYKVKRRVPRFFKRKQT